MNVSMIGPDTAKSVFQVHAVDETGQMVMRRKLHRSELIAFFKKLQGCHGRHGSMWGSPSLGPHADRFGT